MKLRNSLILISFFLLSISFGKAQSNSFETLKSLEIMDQIYEHLELYFVDETKNGQLAKTGIHA